MSNAPKTLWEAIFSWVGDDLGMGPAKPETNSEHESERWKATCPKCGCPDVHTLWAEAMPTTKRQHECWMRHAMTEHFDRHCRGCSYGWATEDVLDV